MTIPDIFSDEIFEPDFYQFFTDDTRDKGECEIKVTVVFLDETTACGIFKGLYTLGSIELKEPALCFIVEILHASDNMRGLKLSCEHEFFYWPRLYKTGDKVMLLPDSRIMDIQTEPNPTPLRRKSWQITSARRLVDILRQLGQSLR